MIRRPPRSTLFPSPPLFRSGGVQRGVPLVVGRVDVDAVREEELHRLDVALVRDPVLLLDRRHSGGGHERRRAVGRSEEHTSELQSQSNLVCRLLLEKKKKKN